MMPYLLLAFGLLMLSLAVTYFWWVRYREWILKQDLYEIRDRLWDEAYANGFLNDEGYRAARAALNMWIRFAPRFSLPVWRYMLTHAHERSSLTQSLRRLPEADAAMAKAVERITQYIFGQTLLGIAYRLWARLRGKDENVVACENEGTRKIMNSRELRDFDREYQAATAKEMAIA